MRMLASSMELTCVLTAKLISPPFCVNSSLQMKDEGKRVEGLSLRLILAVHETSWRPFTDYSRFPLRLA